jgi:hypothetical protein
LFPFQETFVQIKNHSAATFVQRTWVGLVGLVGLARDRTVSRPMQLVIATAAIVVFSNSAQAVPSFARQTGADCGACHVGAFGPQLTPFGWQFKLGGYVDTDGKDGKVPLSAMAVINATRTSKDLPEAPEHFKANNNRALQEISGFLAGRVSDSVGAFVQSTYSGVERKWALDQVDIRFARQVKLGESDAVVGLSLNTNPTLTDPFNTIGQWRFPYTESDFGFGVGATPLIENLGSTVLGLNAYTLYDKNFYAEVGLYNTLSQRALSAINADDAGNFQGPGVSWRVAYVNDRKRDNFSVGLVGFHASVQPDRTQLGTADRYNDVGVDAAYQYLGNRQHVVTVNASWMREQRRLNFSAAEGAAENVKGSLETARIAASYHYDQSWGLNLGLFDSRGSADAELYGAVSHTDRPDTRGYTLQADWTPFGKETSWAAPWANLRVGLQYTGYQRYNGGRRYIDEVNAVDRKASDNNTLMLFLWTAL